MLKSQAEDLKKEIEEQIDLAVENWDCHSFEANIETLRLMIGLRIDDWSKENGLN